MKTFLREAKYILSSWQWANLSKKDKRFILLNHLEYNQSKLKARINEDARIFAYSINPKEWKSRTPVTRRESYLEGAVNEIKRSLTLIDSLILVERDSEQLKKLRRLILQVE